MRLVRKKLKYRVKWVGLDEDPEEYLAEDLRNAPKALQAFHEQYPDLPGPPRNLQYWLQCMEDDTFAESRTTDNLAG